MAAPAVPSPRADPGVRAVVCSVLLFQCDYDDLILVSDVCGSGNLQRRPGFERGRKRSPLPGRSQLCGAGARGAEHLQLHGRQLCVPAQLCFRCRAGLPAVCHYLRGKRGDAVCLALPGRGHAGHGAYRPHVPSDADQPLHHAGDHDSRRLGRLHLGAADRLRRRGLGASASTGLFRRGPDTRRAHLRTQHVAAGIAAAQLGDLRRVDHQRPQVLRVVLGLWPGSGAGGAGHRCVRLVTIRR